MTEEEHKSYHLEVALDGCGVAGCDFLKALDLHFQALNEADDVQGTSLLGDEKRPQS